jgi:hypothetical protein
MDDRDCLLDRSVTRGNSLLLRAVRKAANVYGVSDRNVPDWLDYHVFTAGSRLLRVDYTCWPVDAIVWVLPAATPIKSTDQVALDTAKTHQEC